MKDCRNSIVYILQCQSFELHDDSGKLIMSGCCKRFPLYAFTLDFVELL